MMTIQDIVTIVGESVDADEVTRLRTAAKHAAKFLRSRGGVFLSDDSRHYDAVESLARASGDAGRMDEAEAEMNRVHEWLEQAEAPLAIKDAATSACSLYAPQIGAAYYLGLAVGLRLAAGGGAR